MITIVHGEDPDRMEEVAKRFNGEIILYPEYRLHQQKQADLLVDLIIRSRTEDLVIVTFSEVFVNCIGAFIYRQHVKRENVKIILCDNEGWIESQFDQENAYLDPWPYGHFNWSGMSIEEERGRKLALLYSHLIEK